MAMERMGATRRSRANTRRTLAAKKEYETLRVKLNSPKNKVERGELHMNELDDKLLTYLFILVTKLLREAIEALSCIFYVKDARYKPPFFESLNCVYSPFYTANMSPFRYRSKSLFRCSEAS